MDSNKIPAVSAAGKGEVTMADENTLRIVSPPLVVRSPIAFRTWLQVATNTASVVSSMDHGRRGGRFYGTLSDVRDAYRMTNRADPNRSTDINDTLRAAFPGGRFDEPYRDRIRDVWGSFMHDRERLQRAAEGEECHDSL
jgi:hypothetical protein